MITQGAVPREQQPNHPVLVTAARLRIGMNVNGIVRAAARDGQR
jgi:hypothetical protein